MSERQLSDLFHRLKNLFPEEQELITVPPEMTAGEALQLMREHNFNQLPIVAGTAVLGVFSYRSFAAGIMELGKRERDPLEIAVEALSEDLAFARITDDVQALLEEFDLRDTVLIGSEDRLQGVVTTIDALRYFYKAASPFVMLQEIELAIRELLRTSLDETGLKKCINRCLRSHYEGKKEPVPERLEEMTFRDYVTILECGDLWPIFKDAFGGSYPRLKGTLEGLPEIRNSVFHFKRELTVLEYDGLKDCRNWLLKRIRKIEGVREERNDA